MLPENTDRLSHPKMAWYRDVYKDSERWNGADSIDGKTVIVYGEQGYGDIIQFARYIPVLKKLGCSVVFHCPTPLHRLFLQFEVELLDKENGNLPDHDYHIPSMSLPFVLDQLEVSQPYLSVEPEDFSDLEGLKVGIAWEGNPDHSNTDERNCPLTYFRVLEKLPLKMVIIQKSVHLLELTVGCDDMELYGYPIVDFLDTAKIIQGLDCVISVDTSVLHLAGALGKKSFVLLSHRCDPRWNLDLTWYSSITLLKQAYPGDWEGALIQAQTKIKELLDRRKND